MLIGIDPGAGGALALIDGSGKIAAVEDMPTTEHKGRRRVNPVALAGIVRQWAPAAAILEQVHSMPRDGAVGAFAFGKSTGIVVGVLGALRIPLTEVPPQEWKRVLRVPAMKDAARARATQLLPGASHLWPLKKHDGRAEAALIALWGARHSGMIAAGIDW